MLKTFSCKSIFLFSAWLPGPPTSVLPLPSGQRRHRGGPQPADQQHHRHQLQQQRTAVGRSHQWPHKSTRRRGLHPRPRPRVLVRRQPWRQRRRPGRQPARGQRWQQWRVEHARRQRHVCRRPQLQRQFAGRRRRRVLGVFLFGRGRRRRYRSCHRAAACRLRSRAAGGTVLLPAAGCGGGRSGLNVLRGQLSQHGPESLSEHCYGELILRRTGENLLVLVSNSMHLCTVSSRSTLQVLIFRY